MNFLLRYFLLPTMLFSQIACITQDKHTDFFAHPERGFISNQPAENWQHGLLTGNGTIGAIIMGKPYNETITLSHELLYLPYEKTEAYMEIRDPFIAAFNLRIQQAGDSINRYQRSVNFMTAEAIVSVENQHNTFQRNTFVSRSDDVIVIRLKGRKKLSAKFSFEGLVPENDKEKAIVAEGIKSKQEGVKDDLLYFHTLFANTNAFNPAIGYEGVGKIIAKGGSHKA